MSAATPRITKPVSYTVAEWEPVEKYLTKRGLEFSPFAKAAIAEKIVREEK